MANEAVTHTAKGIGDLLVSHLSKQGLSVLLLFIIAALLVFRDNNNLSDIREENRELKKENRALLSASHAELITNQRAILEKQNQILIRLEQRERGFRHE